MNDRAGPTVADASAPLNSDPRTQEPTVMRPILRLMTATPVLVAGLLVTSGCEKGPAEKAGAKIDNAADALNPKGPGEKLGQKVDNATGK